MTTAIKRLFQRTGYGANQKDVVRFLAVETIHCGHSSVGRASASQAEGRGSEPRCPLQSNILEEIPNLKKAAEWVDY